MFFALACLIMPLTALAQTQTQRPAATTTPAKDSGTSTSTGGGRSGLQVVMYEDADYQLAPLDVFEVIVEDAPELSVNYKINSSGVVRLNFLGPTHVEGKTCEEVSNLIADRLRGRYLKDPKVYVTVKQYNSRTFFISGAVRSPGVYVVPGRITIFKLLTAAGGLLENHGSTAYIFREVKAKPEKLETRGQPDAAGENDRLKEIVNNAKGTDPSEQVVSDNDYDLVMANIGGILRGRLRENIFVEPGDVVYVPPGDVFYVAGAVIAPGQYQLRQGITLRQAISLAQGTPFKAKLDKSVIFREDPATGKFTEVSVDIGSIMSGKGQDMPIYPNDVVFIPSSGVKSVSSALLLALGTSAAFRLPGIR